MAIMSMLALQTGIAVQWKLVVESVEEEIEASAA